MSRKRIKGKRKKYLKFGILTSDLIWVIFYGYDCVVDRRDIDIDLKDKKLVKEIWDLHKEAVMKDWNKNKTDLDCAGLRPLFWWLVEAPEPRKILRYQKYNNKEYPVYESSMAYLLRLNLLEDWELEEHKRIQKLGIDDPEWDCAYGNGETRQDIINKNLKKYF